MSDYADALAWTVRRYGNQVYSYEIWNEPNQDYFFHTDDPVGRYANMVKAAYPAAKAADPRPIIVAGSLSDSDFEFTDALFRHGVKGHFDAWSVHPYSDDRSPLNTAVESPRYSFLSGVPAVRDVMRRYGDHKPIWLTEFGWSTCNVRGPVSWQNCVDRDTQATYLKRAFRQMASWSDVPVGIWFNLENTTSAPDDRVGNYGLLTQDDSPKPSFWAFRQSCSCSARTRGRAASSSTRATAGGSRSAGTATSACAFTAASSGAGRGGSSCARRGTRTGARLQPFSAADATGVARLAGSGRGRQAVSDRPRRRIPKPAAISAPPAATTSATSRPVNGTCFWCSALQPSQ
jgi:hypothetical protein